mgnify:CR=1 FL=1
MDAYLTELVNVFNANRERLQGTDTLEMASHRKGLHNHVELAHQFLTSKYYQSRIPEFEQYFHERFGEIDIHNTHNQIVEYNSELGEEFNKVRIANADKEFFDLEDLKEYVELYTKHFAASHVIGGYAYRFPIDRFDDYNLQEIIDAYNYIFYPDRYEICYFQTCLSAIWTLIHVGMSDYAIRILDKIREDFSSFLETGQSIFLFLDNEAHIPRHAQTTDWAYAWAYRQLGNNTQAVYHLKQIVSRHPINVKNDRFKVFWHTGVARILEAAVQVYKLEPTEENFLSLQGIIKSNHELECQEHTESLREMLMAIYSYTKLIHNYPA